MQPAGQGQGGAVDGTGFALKGVRVPRVPARKVSPKTPAQTPCTSILKCTHRRLAALRLQVCEVCRVLAQAVVLPLGCQQHVVRALGHVQVVDLDNKQVQEGLQHGG